MSRPPGPDRPLSDRALALWQKWRHYDRNERFWRRARLRRHMLRDEWYLRFPVTGNLLEALDEGRAEVGPWALIEAGCWFALYPETATMRIGEGTILNLGCMVAATERVEIGSHCMFANYCFVADAEHRYDDRELPVTWQGMEPKGPVRIGDSCWFGTNVS